MDNNKYKRYQVTLVNLKGEHIPSKKPTIFSGSMSTRASYFRISGKFTFEVSYKGDYVYSKPKNLVFEKIHPDIITRDEYNYFMLELAPTPKQVQILQPIFDELPMSVTTFKALNVFSEFQMDSKCAYFRIDYEAPLRVLFENQKSISDLSSEELVELSTMVTQYPWKACFSKFTGKKLKEARYAGFHAYRLNHYKGHPIQPLYLRAIRLYGFIRSQNEKGHELFRVSSLFKEYRADDDWGPLAYDCNDTDEVLIPALEFLMFHAMGNANYKDTTNPPFPEFIATFRDIRINRDIIDILCNRLARNANVVTKTIQSINAPCIPSPLLSNDQTNFVKHALTNRISLLEGAPGTGKTEVLVAIVAHLTRRKKGTRPTGPIVATYVSNMVEALRKRFGNRPETANTIHYVCCFVEGASKEAIEWISKFNVLILDEGSNIDIKLFGRLLRCMPNIAQLVIVGDLGQIFPIKSGAPFCDLVNTFPQHSFRLIENKRVEKDSLALAEAAALIRDGKSREVRFSSEKDSPLRFIERTNDRHQQFASIIHDTVKTVADIMNFQVVVLRNKDRKELNTVVEEVLIKKGILKKPAVCKMRIPCGDVFPGRKLTFTKNYKADDNHDSVRNGELGQVKRVINSKTFEFTNGKQISIEFIDPKDIQPGYATTCNRSQGNEWSYVVMWIYENPNPFFTREYAYVGISRAKKQSIIIGTEEEFHRICKEKAKERRTLLRFYLFLERGCIELERLNEYNDLHLLPSGDFRLLSPDELAVPVPAVPAKAEKNKKMKI
jgi:tRNA A37 threonylcarbamoyladenosine biosynthesis protein TsaE